MEDILGSEIHHAGQIIEPQAKIRKPTSSQDSYKAAKLDA